MSVTRGSFSFLFFLVFSLSGLPYVTSHYGFHMVLWHITLALSGQDANLPAGSLSFEPKLSPPYNLPVLLPGVLGSLSAVPQDHAVCYTLSLAFGQLTLQHLAVGSDVCPDNPVVIKPGTPVTWLS